MDLEEKLQKCLNFIKQLIKINYQDHSEEVAIDCQNFLDTLDNEDKK